MQELELGRRYAESEVNETISRFHEDYATIRREFILRRMMDREGGYYWRIGQASQLVATLQLELQALPEHKTPVRRGLLFSRRNFL